MLNQYQILQVIVYKSYLIKRIVYETRKCSSVQLNFTILLQNKRMNERELNTLLLYNKRNNKLDNFQNVHKTIK